MSLISGLLDVGSAILPFDPTPGFRLSSSDGGSSAPAPRPSPTATAPRPSQPTAAEAQQPSYPDVYYAQQVAAQQAAAADAARKQQAVDYINKAYDTKIAGLQDQYNTLSPMEKAAQLQVSNQYTNRGNDLQTGFATGERNLNFATDQVNTSKARSLDDLARMIQQAHMGYNNQLGAMGAGDSSAWQLVNQALSGKASRNRGDVLQNASGQLTQIDMQHEDLQNSFDSQKRALEDWKQSTLTDLMTNFAQQKAAIRAAMQDADLNRQQQLAQYDTSLTQSVMDRLSDIQAQTHAAAKDLQNRYMHAFAPQAIQIDPKLQQYAVKPISAGQLGQLKMPNQVTANDPGTQVVLKKLEDEQNSLPTGV